MPRFNSIEQLIALAYSKPLAVPSPLSQPPLWKTFMTAENAKRSWRLSCRWWSSHRMVAPVFGAFPAENSVLENDVRHLAIFGAFASVLALCYRETLESKYQGSIFPVTGRGRPAAVMKNRSFIKLPVIFSITPQWRWWASCRRFYLQHDFGLTEQQFSYAFAFNALCASFGPTLYMKLSLPECRFKKVISGVFYPISDCRSLYADSRWFTFGSLCLSQHQRRDGYHHARRPGTCSYVESARSRHRFCRRIDSVL